MRPGICSTTIMCRFSTHKNKGHRESALGLEAAGACPVHRQGLSVLGQAVKVFEEEMSLVLFDSLAMTRTGH